jgi:hypothetical protein
VSFGHDSNLNKTTTKFKMFSCTGHLSAANDVWRNYRIRCQRHVNIFIHKHFLLDTLAQEYQSMIRGPHAAHVYLSAILCHCV